MRSFYSTIAVATLLTAGLCALAADQPKAQIGQPAPSFTLQDQNGKPVSLSDFSGKIVVLEWVNPQCPFVQRHYREKTMITLADSYKSQGVVWLAINSSNFATSDDNRKWVEQNNLSYPILNDASGQVGHLYGAKTTPDMFIIARDGTLVYSGGIDNDRDGSKGSDRVNYVRKALDEILAGKSVSEAQTPSYGCNVKYAE